MTLLLQSFFRRDALKVARDLIGKELRCDSVRLRIVEVEAYRNEDSANHCHRGKTERNAPMWCRGGLSYVYRCYGIHSLLNVVTGEREEGQGVLIRACEPLCGLPTVWHRRGRVRGPALLNGPGKVGAALALVPNDSGIKFFRAGKLELHKGPSPRRLVCGPRVGIDYAAAKDRLAPWRIADAESRWVGHRRTLG